MPAAVAYIDQAAGVAQFTNERSADAAVQALLKLIQVKPDPSFRLDQSPCDGAHQVWRDPCRRRLRTPPGR